MSTGVLTPAALADARTHFENETTEHQLTVKHDDGLYRHLTFKRPGTGFYRFDLITWPGHLTITGGMDTFTFARTEDMFEFFAGSRHHPDKVNPTYWAEKVTAGQTVRYDRDYTLDRAREAAADAVKQRGEDVAAFDAEWAEARAAGVTPADADTAERERLLILHRNSLAVLQEINDQARDFADDLFTDESAHRWLAELDGNLGFSDTFEWSLNTYTHQFLWCCHAIAWGIAKYRTETPAPDAKVDIHITSQEAPIRTVVMPVLADAIRA